jgi:hypothetical protein
MAQIKLKFSRLSIPEKIARARQIVTAMTGNAHFTTPQPPLSVITAAADELEAAAADTQAARQTAKTKTTIQNSKEDVLDRVVSQEGGYVTATSGGDEAIIQSAGMDVRAAPGTIGIPSPPQALGATAGDHDGQMDLSWDPVVEAASHVLETSPDPPTATSWSHVGVSTKSSFTVTGLQSGSRIWFRVAAINPAGQSGWSDPATKIAP